jgi:hypothetical protein
MYFMILFKKKNTDTQLCDCGSGAKRLHVGSLWCLSGLQAMVFTSTATDRTSCAHFLNVRAIASVVWAPPPHCKVSIPSRSAIAGHLMPKWAPSTNKYINMSISQQFCAFIRQHGSGVQQVKIRDRCFICLHPGTSARLFGEGMPRLPTH